MTLQMTSNELWRRVALAAIQTLDLPPLPGFDGAQVTDPSPPPAQLPDPSAPADQPADSRHPPTHHHPPIRAFNQQAPLQALDSRSDAKMARRG